MMLATVLLSAITAANLVDLTYDFDENTIYWPTARAFHFEKEAWGKSPGGYWYSAGRYSASEHGGTHLDAPIHFAEGKAGVDGIPVARLVRPALVIDVSSKAARQADYQLSAPGRLLPRRPTCTSRASGRTPPPNW